MRRLPEGWRVYDGRVPEPELRRLEGRFRVAVRRHNRALRLHKIYSWTGALALPTIGIAALCLELATSSSWPPPVMLKHLASAPNCAAARAVGLAPAHRGEPGYWSRHDRDQDGVACERGPRR